MSRMNSAARWIAAGLTLAVLSGCGASTGIASAGAPWKVCGHVLWSTAAMPVPLDVTRWPSREPISQATVGDNLDLLLSHNCSAGVDVSFSRRSAAVIANSVAASGGLVAAVIHPRRSRFDIRLAGADGNHKVLHIALS